MTSTLDSKPVGFRDAHTHLSAGAADLMDLDLRELPSDADNGAAIARKARAVAPGAWVRAWGWDGVRPPADPAPDHPTVVTRRDGHAAWLNAAGLAALGLTAGSSIVEEAAFEEMRSRLPRRTAAERLEALLARVAELRRLGVTSVDDMVEPWAPELYAAARDRGALPLAVGMWLPESIDEAEAEAVRRAFPPGGRDVATRGIKIFLDGTLSARTAALSFPYADDPGNSGALRIDPRELGDRVARWASKGWPIALHAIGDRAVSVALDELERAPRADAGAHRIEHAQVVLRSDLPRFARAGVVASVQPGHWRDDRAWLAARLGDRPEVVAHPLRSFSRAGAAMAFGSDWPVSAWDPAIVLASAGDPGRGVEALDAGEASAWYTSAPR